VGSPEPPKRATTSRTELRDSVCPERHLSLDRHTPRQLPPPPSRSRSHRELPPEELWQPTTDWRRTTTAEQRVQVASALPLGGFSPAVVTACAARGPEPVNVRQKAAGVSWDCDLWGPAAEECTPSRRSFPHYECAAPATSSATLPYDLLSGPLKVAEQFLLSPTAAWALQRDP